MIEIGKGGQRPVKTVLLSRYASYLAIQNADPKKEIVAHGQTYFATQTRRQELADKRVEDERRVLLREDIRRHNVQLVGAAKDAGVIEPIDYAIFQNHGYMGLYGGLMQEDIHRRKGLKKSQKILDHMGSTELAANLFRATQAEEKLRRENVKGKDAANRTHREVGAKVRQTIQELGGTMPEKLPVAESIKKIETRQRKQLGNSPTSTKKKSE
jgi:DNA-damage-inducible protein D